MIVGPRRDVSEQSQSSSKPSATTPEGTGRHRSRRRREATRWEYIIAIAVVAGIAAAFSSARPTGIALFDVIERAAFGVVVTLFAACCRRWAWLILAGVATVLAEDVWGHLLGLVGLGFAVHAAVRTDTRDRTTGALIGALSAQALLRTDDVGFFGLTALIVGVTVTLVIVSGYRTIRRRNRSRILIGTGILVAFIVVASAGFAYSVARAAKPLQDGIRSAKTGLTVADKSDQTGAAGYWTSSHNSFAKADGFLSSPLAKLAYPIPVLAQHARLASAAADSGSSITQTAARAATVAPYQRLRAADGTFDLARISSMVKPVTQTEASMVAARDDVDSKTSPWLVSPLRSRVDDYRTQLVRAIPQARNALAAIKVAPELLGGHGPRRYLLLFGNPAESRGLGGFIGAWAQLDANNGHLELTRHGKMAELNDATDPNTRKIVGEPEYLARYGYLQPARYLQNISASPDFPTVARVAEQLYPQAGGTTVDGVMYVDPTALAALLKLTGPVTADGVPMPLTSENAAQFLMHDQYVDVPDASDRTDLLSNAAQATFDALTHRQLPSILNITKVMSPVMHARHIMAAVTDEEADDYLDSIGLTGAFPRPGRDDQVSVRMSNASENKADYYLRNLVAYQVQYNEATGKTTGKVSFFMQNTAPTSGDPDYVLGNPDTRAGRTDGRPYGSNTVMVSVYTALRPTSMTIDGHPVPMQVQRELGSWVASQHVTIPSKAYARVVVDVEGSTDPSGPYQLTAVRQPVAQYGLWGSFFTLADEQGKPIPHSLQKFTLERDAVGVFRQRRRAVPGR